MQKIDKNQFQPTIDVLETIKRVRKAKNINQFDMGKKLGMGQSTYAHIEVGDTALTIPRLQEICGVLEININDMFQILPTGDVVLYQGVVLPREEADALAEMLQNSDGRALFEALLERRINSPETFDELARSLVKMMNSLK